jgi:ubiquinone/menaquinone biosynthesis C-methylase UbiE
MNAEYLALPNKSFDVVVAQFVITGTWFARDELQGSNTDKPA